MNYKIEVLAEKETIKITVDGKLTPYEKTKASFEAIDKLNINNYQRLLYDFSSAISSKKNTCGDSIDLFNDIKKRQLGKKIKLAFITKDITQQHRSFVILLKTITNMDGKHFKSHEDAIEWLKK